MSLRDRFNADRIVVEEKWRIKPELRARVTTTLSIPKSQEEVRESSCNLLNVLTGGQMTTATGYMAVARAIIAVRTAIMNGMTFAFRVDYKTSMFKISDDEYLMLSNDAVERAWGKVD